MLGADHVATLACAANLAGDLADAGAADGAILLAVDVVDRLQRVQSDRHPVTCGCRMNLALDRGAAGDDDDGDGAMERLVEALGADHPEVTAIVGGRRLDIGIEALDL